MPIARRPVLALLAGAFALPALAAQVEEIADLKPGDYTWHPERSPDGPVAIVVSLPDQLLHVYRNGIRIGVTTVSSGKPGHLTPTGVFVVLQKDKHHHSSTYNNAPMPNTERLTWSGIALHAGGLPGYPSSHGCVHMPLDFSARLFAITHLATPVIIAGAATDPWELVHPGLLLSGAAEGELAAAVAGLDARKQPADWTAAEAAPVVSVVASSFDRRVVMLEDGALIGEGRLTSDHGVFGEHVLTLQDAGADGLRWSAVSYDAAPDATPAPAPDALAGITADAAFASLLRDKLHPGMILVLTDLPTSPDTRSGEDFVILS